MSNSDAELPEIVDDGTNNNYSEWKTRSYHKLRDWNLLKYIEGPSSQPPIIPPLRFSETVIRHDLDDNGHCTTVHDVPGNLAEHEQAVRDAESWMTGNDTALARIVCAVPSHQLHLVGHVKYAKQAWDSLHSAYRLRNSLNAPTIRRQFMTYRCQSDMNVAKWLDEMQRLYYSLRDVDTERISDRDFVLTILVLMPQDQDWRAFLSNLRTKFCDSDSQGLAIDATAFTTAIREEYWDRHKDDYEIASQTFSARFDAERRNNNNVEQKRPRNAADLSTTPGASPSAPAVKRARRVQNANSNAKRVCTNPHCSALRGHHTAVCVAYKGAKEGKYSRWWHGPWNIHLPPSQRSKENNVPPKSHPAYARLYGQAHLADGLVERSSTSQIQSDDDNPHAN